MKFSVKSILGGAVLAVLLVAAPAPGAQAPAPAQSAAPQVKTWFIHLIPPRATFMTDMTAAESALMQQHVEYWKQEYAKGVLVFGGPVFDAHGAYGVIVLRAANEDEARAIASADPTVKGGVNKIDVAEMKVSFPLKTE
jgi:uncharacterized protein YciI